MKKVGIYLKKWFKTAVWIVVVIVLFLLLSPLLKSFFGSCLPSVVERTTHGVDLSSRFNEVKAKENIRIMAMDTTLLELDDISQGEAFTGQLLEILHKGQMVILDPKTPVIEFQGLAYLKIKLLKNDDGYQITGYVNSGCLSVKDDSHNTCPQTEILYPSDSTYVYVLGAGDASNWLTFPADQSISYRVEASNLNYSYEKNGKLVPEGKNMKLDFCRGEVFRIRAKTAQVIRIKVTAD